MQIICSTCVWLEKSTEVAEAAHKCWRGGRGEGGGGGGGGEGAGMETRRGYVEVGEELSAATES